MLYNRQEPIRYQMESNKTTKGSRQIAVIGNAKLTDPILEEKCIALGHALSFNYLEHRDYVK